MFQVGDVVHAVDPDVGEFEGVVEHIRDDVASVRPVLLAHHEWDGELWQFHLCDLFRHPLGMCQNCGADGGEGAYCDSCGTNFGP